MKINRKPRSRFLLLDVKATKLAKIDLIKYMDLSVEVLMEESVSVLQPPRGKGIFLVLTGAILWGVSGTVAQYLFQKQGFSPEWLVVTRLLVSGLILLVYSHFKMKQSIWKIWHRSIDRKDMILFGLFGMLAVQYTYFAAIHHGNAATATEIGRAHV